MPTYVYEIQDGPNKGKTVELQQSIKDLPAATIEIEGRECEVKRIIAGSTNFILKGGGWGNVGYDRGIQSKLSKEDRDNLDKKP